MNLLRIKFLFTILMVISINAKAQWITENSIGFGWGLNKSSFGYKKTIIPGDSTINSQPFSLGNGNRLGFNFVKNDDSTMLQYIVGLSYLFENNARIKSYTDSQKQFASSVGFHCPQLRLLLMTGVSTKRWFVRSGVIIPLISNFTENRYLKDSGFIMNTKGKVKLNPSIGLRVEAGIAFKIKSGFSLAISGFAEALSINRKRMTLSSYSDNLDGNIENQYKSLSEREINYFKEPFAGMNNPNINPNGFNTNKPLDELSKSVSFSSIGLAVSISYYF